MCFLLYFSNVTYWSICINYFHSEWYYEWLGLYLFVTLIPAWLASPCAEYIYTQNILKTALWRQITLVKLFNFQSIILNTEHELDFKFNTKKSINFFYTYYTLTIYLWKYSEQELLILKLQYIFLKASHCGVTWGTFFNYSKNCVRTA